MAINKAVIAKKVNGTVEYIYPKTSADMVDCGNNTSVQEKIESLESTNTELNNKINSFQGGMKYVNSAEDMIDTSRAYVYDGEWYYYDSTTESWISGGDVAGLETDTTLTVSGAAADAAVVGNRLMKTQIVEQLPVTGVANTIYLISKGVNKGYDKYWYITDNGVSKWDVFGGSSTEIVNSLPNSGDEDVDYVLVTNNGYFYYKWINNDWRVIGGSMATIVDDIDDLPETGNELTDYYVAQSNGSYQHYRWKDAEDENEESEYHIVGGDSYTKSEVNALFSPINSSISSLQTSMATANSNIAANADDISDLQDALDSIDDSVYKYTATYGKVTIDGEEVDNVFRLYKYKGEEIDEEDEESIVGQFIIQGGGGGESANMTAKINYQKDTNNNNITSLQCVYGGDCNIGFYLDAKDSDGEYSTIGNGIGSWYVSKDGKTWTLKVSDVPITNGNVLNTYNVGQFLNSGINYVRLAVTLIDENGIAVTVKKKWTVNAINLKVEWDYDDLIINNIDSNSTFNIEYTVTGDLDKTVHLKIDDEDVVSTSVSTARGTITLDITDDDYAAYMTNGSHKFELYLTAVITNTDLTTINITSNIVKHNVIFVEANGDPIISSPITSITVTQGNTINIPYSVYDPENELATITYMKNGEDVSSDGNKERETQYHWYYKPTDGDYDENGAMTLGIKCGTTVKTFNITVEKLNIDIEETSGQAFKLNMSTIASNSALRSWEDNGTTISFSNNFDWVNGGIKQETDSDGNVNQMLCIKAGTTATINYKLFGNDATANGKCFKIIFKAVNVDDYDAVILNCIDTHRDEGATEDSEYVGIKLGANGGIIQTRENRGDSALKVQYSEESYIEFEYEICSNKSFTYYKTYIDGVMSDVKLYGATLNNFTQDTPKDIIIGSENCDVYVYFAVVYEKELSILEHLNNFILNAPNASEIIDRHNRNNIYTIENGNIEIDPEELAKKNPNCRVHLWKIPEMPTEKYKKGEKQISGCEYEQIYNGVYLDDEDNEVEYSRIKATNINIGVQGTSSIKYISSAANTDGEFLSGFDVYDSDDNIVDHVDAYSMEKTSIPTNYFNTKVNVASCENINNMCLAEWYNRYQPYKTANELKNPKARNCMEHHMGVQFIMDTHEPDHATGNGNNFHVFNNDNKYHMYAICNMGNSKNSFGVFHDITNPNECCVETLDNDSNICMMKQALTMETLYPAKKEDTVFEFRYPKKPTSEMEQAFINFTAWMASCNPANATNEQLPEPVTYYPYTFEGTGRGADVLAGTTIYQYGCEYDDVAGDFIWYDDVDSQGNPIKVRREGRTFTHDTFSYRVAKMLNECEDHLIMDSIVYHYVFVEQHAMVDNTCKNTFWGTEDLVHWHLVKNYDNDTADGNDNTGKLTIPSCAEGLDNKSSGAGVFNGNGHAYWQFIYGLYEARKVMWQNRASAGAWNYENYLAFANERQKCIPEIVWNKDYWYKYLRPWETSIEPKYLNMFFGGRKTHQREYFVTDNYWYMASQYNAGRYRSSSISFRSYSPNNAILMPKSEIQIMLYRDGYITFAIGNKEVRTKAKRNQFKTLTFENNSTNDSVVSIFGSINIKAIGDMTSLYTADISIVNAPRLRSLKINCVKKFEGNLTITSNGNIKDSNNNIIGKLNSFIDNDGNIIKNISDYIYIDYDGIIHGKDQNDYVTTLGTTGNVSLDASGNVINNTTGAIIATGGVIVGKIGTATMNNDDGDIIDSEGNVIDRCLNKVCNSVSIDSSVKMLEELYIQNCPRLLSSVFNAFNFQRLKVFNTRNSNINSVIFANGGLLEELCMNKPLILLMRNLNRLTNEKITIQDISELASLLCESCSNIDTLQLLNRFKIEENGEITSLTSLSNVTITDIDWEFDNKSLLDYLYTLNGITIFQNNQGVDTPSPTNNSILSGSVYINWPEIRSGDITKYQEKWPGLNITFNYENFIRQFQVTYLIDKSDAGIDEDVILGRVYTDWGATPLNIGFLNSDTLDQSEFSTYGVIFPTKQTTQEYIYTFDHWDENDLTNHVNAAGTCTVTARFVATHRTYNVYWYAHPDDIAKGTSAAIHEVHNIEYGTGIEYTTDTAVADFPEAFADKFEKEYVNNFSVYNKYSLFMDNWDKCTGTVIDDMHVAGVWEEATRPEKGTKTLHEMNMAEKYCVFKSDYFFYDAEQLENPYFELKDYMDIKFGGDIDFTNVESQLLVENRHFNGSEIYDTGIKLFDEDSPSFTLSVDFQVFGDYRCAFGCGYAYNTNSYGGFTVNIPPVSYYYPESTLYYGRKEPSLWWGNNYQLLQELNSQQYCRYNYNYTMEHTESNSSISYKEYKKSDRNTIVIRHLKGDKTIYVYTNRGNSNSTNRILNQTATVTEYSMTRSSYLLTDATLTFGGYYTNSEKTSNTRCRCNIYFAKIWFDDLGTDVCKKLAKGIHRIDRMDVQGYNLYNKSGENIPCKISFIQNNLYYYGSFSNSVSVSSYNGFGDAYDRMPNLNNVYNILPKHYKSLITEVSLKGSVPSNTLICYKTGTYEGSTEYYYKSNKSSSSLDTFNGYKIYIPAYTELTGIQEDLYSSYLGDEGVQIAWFSSGLSGYTNNIVYVNGATSINKYQNECIYVPHMLIVENPTYYICNFTSRDSNKKLNSYIHNAKLGDIAIYSDGQVAYYVPDDFTRFKLIIGDAAYRETNWYYRSSISILLRTPKYKYNNYFSSSNHYNLYWYHLYGDSASSNSRLVSYQESSMTDSDYNGTTSTGGYFTYCFSI